jgi:anthranilate phosphoribosyltransferase
VFDLGKKADIVILNAAAGIFVGGMVDSIEEGISAAKETIGSGAAMNILVELAAVK